MDVNLAKLPDNINSLKAIITSFSDKTHNYKLENNLLREQVRLLRAQIYARKSEKLPLVTGADQPTLFDEAEQTVSAQEEEVTKEIEVAGYKRKPRGRKPLPPDLPRIEIVHDISEAEGVDTNIGVFQIADMPSRLSEKPVDLFSCFLFRGWAHNLRRCSPLLLLL